MNYKSVLGIFGIAMFMMSCSDPQPQGAIVGDVSNGKAIFDVNCAVCHQKDGKGKAGFAPSINNIDFLAVADDHMIKRFILEGRAGTSMIPFKNNPNVADKVDDVVAYMRSWTNDFPLYKEAIVDHNWESNGDAGNGEALFTNYCAACHGNQGQGYSAGGSGTGIGSAAFVSLVPDDYIKQTLQKGRAGTAMKPFDGAKGVANLSNEEMDDVIAFLRTKAAYIKLAAVGNMGSPSEGGFTTTSILSDPYMIFICAVALFALLAILYLLTIIVRLQKIVIK
jgi:mono/diheme cytochrome c family protein